MLALSLYNFAMDSRLAGNDPEKGWWGVLAGRQVFQMKPNELKWLQHKFKLYAVASIVACLGLVALLYFGRSYLALVSLAAALFFAFSSRFCQIQLKEQKYLEIMQNVSQVTIPDITLDDGRPVARKILEKNTPCNRLYVAQVLIDDYFRPRSPNLAYLKHARVHDNKCICEFHEPPPPSDPAAPKAARPPSALQESGWWGTFNRFADLLVNSWPET